MLRRNLDDTLAVIQRLDRARSIAELTDELLMATSSYGVQKLMAAVAPPPNLTEIEQAGYICLTNWSNDWLERYLKRGYASIDPAVALMARSTSFHWAEIDQLIEVDRAGQRLMAEAGDYGLADGATVGMRTVEGYAAGFSFAGDRLEMPPEASERLSLIANYAFVRALKTNEMSRAVPRMSIRARDILRWVAEGKTDWEIGMILNLSEHTVDKYLRALKSQLAATNRANLVARAFRLGLIE